MSFTKYAWFSKTHEAATGSWEIDTVDGKVVRVTDLFDDKTLPTPSSYADAVYVGVVFHGTFRNKSFLSNFNPESIKAIRRQLAAGEICAVCGAEWKERFLFYSSYIGCHC